MPQGSVSKGPPPDRLHAAIESIKTTTSPRDLNRAIVTRLVLRTPVTSLALLVLPSAA